jgi:hypothetical protein
MKLGLITRCKDECFIKEFCNYYLNQGIDFIHIIDDDSIDKSIYNNLDKSSKIKIYYEKNIIDRNLANELYKQIKDNYDWIIYVDVDEFITTRKNINKTIKQELATTFKNSICIYIPWVMMSCNNIKNTPKSILETNIYRWNHDKKHPNKINKFRCRYNKIESKSIFKPKYFNDITDYNPINKTNNNDNIVESIHNTKVNSIHYNNLREKDINNGYLLCYHYRIISIENSKKKINTNIWYKNYSLNDLLSSDYNEIIDDTLKIKSIKQQIKFIHITKTGGTSIEEVGKKNGMLWGMYDEKLQYKKLKIGKMSGAIWHIPPRNFIKNPYSKHITFAVVRNPYNRILSECFCKWGGKYKTREFQNVDEFNDYITERIKKCMEPQFFHFMPQYIYTHDENNNQIINHIIRFENLKEEFDNLMTNFGLSIVLDIDTNKSIKKYGISDISPENIKLINKVYDNDFKFFNYDKIHID